MRIVVVSLARATERRARMVERLDTLGLDHEIHEATRLARPNAATDGGGP